jgi:DNA mismatch repair protein MutH
MTFDYDIKNKESIISYAKNLEGKSISEKFKVGEPNQKYEAKGYFGQLVERIYFGIENNSRPEPDFLDVGMELKTSPLKMNGKNRFLSKERLVLGIINYPDLPNQEFESSDFWRKNSSLLLIFYLYEKEKIPFDFIIKIVGEWGFASDDFEIIKKDWLHIKNMVNEGRAHELSEGQTYYLGACTKGANSKSLREQPKSKVMAMQRAFSFKQGYVNHIIASLAARSGINDYSKYGKLIDKSEELKSLSIDEIVKNRFSPYIGKNVRDVFNLLGLDYESSSKSKWSQMTNAILKVELGKRIEEFEKAEITIRTVRIGKNNYPKEAISFPAFKYQEFADSEWDDSEYSSQIEKRFMFVFIKHVGNDLILNSVGFWSMPMSDIAECRQVWDKIKNLVVVGKVFKELDSNGRRVTYFSDIRSNVAHVRPHGRDAEDCYPLPVPDVATGATSYTKHSFWLNKEYVRESIFNQI